MPLRVSSLDGGLAKALARGASTPRRDYAPDLLFQLKASRLEDPVREYRFWEGRRFRFDLAWPSRMLACEIEGIVFPKAARGAPTDHRLGGRHVSVHGFRQDLEKYAEATARGWRVLRVSTEMVQDGRALGYLERLLKS